MSARVRTSQMLRKPVYPPGGAATPSAAIASGRPPSNPAERPPDTSLEKTDLEKLVEAAKKALTDEDLFLVMANETRLAAGAQQIFVFRHDPATQITAISGMPRVNRQSPLVQDLEGIVEVLHDAGELDEARMFSLGSDPDDTSPQLKSYPFRSLAWTPVVKGGGRPQVGVLYTRKQPWRQEHLDRLITFADIFTKHLDGAREKSGDPKSRAATPLSAKRKKAGIVAAVLLLIGLCMPTTMTVNAPFQVVSRSHLVVSAPVQGVIETVYIKPGDRVVTGQPLIKFVDIAQKNQVSIARRQVDMSEAVLKRANQMSFEKEEGRSQLGPSLADVAVKRAELQLALEQAARTTINAEANGIAVFSDEKSLIGRPFSIGERILEIADPEQIEFEILMDVNNSIALEDGMQVKLFPDSAPLQSYRARINQVSYLAEPDKMGRLSHRLVAVQEDSGEQPLKLGTSGTAKIFGQQVPLAFYLFRRPIAAARQWLGL